MAHTAEHDWRGPGSGHGHVSASEIELWILSRIAVVTGEPPWTYGPDAEFTAVGLSSRDAVVLAGELESYLGRELPATLAWDHPSPHALARYLAEAPSADAGLSAGTGAGTETGAASAVPIAVVGMACRFPGAPSAEAYWSLLESGRDGLAGPSERRGPRPHGFLPGIDQFDAALFAISDVEAAYVDPQQRLLLEAAWEALEDAAIAPTALAGSHTGVFVGITTSDYGRLQVTRATPRSRFSGTGQALSIAANRLSYLLDLRGPSLAVDTACSSSLMAVHLAVRSLRSGESAVALAGGVNCLLAPDVTELLAEAGTMAPDGRCKTFDAAADGYVRSEGCGMVVLKRLPDALADDDRVLGVILGSAAGQEGRTNGLTAPSGLAQQALLRAALRDARVAPGDIGYVETHGTGTALGDPIEVGALGEVLAAARDADRPLLLGSAKANIGHAEAAAGMAGLIKVLLMLRHRRVPGQIHLRQLSPRLPVGRSVSIPLITRDWAPAPGRALTAGVSSFGFGGAIAHVIVQEPPAPAAPAVSPRPCHLLTLSAASESALAALAGRHAEWLREHPRADLGAVARTTTLGRAHLRHRAAVVAHAHDDARAGLELLAGATVRPDGPAVVHRGQVRPAAGRLAMLFSGGGSQYLNMGRQLYVTSALFRDHLRHCQELLADHLDVPLLSVLFPLPSQRDLLDRIRYTQPALVALEYALAQLWRSWGVVADLVLGHSTGEFAAACVAGALDLADGLRLAAERGRLIEELCEPGSMAIVFAAEDLVRDLAATMPGDRAPTVAAVNAPDAVVVAGRQEDLPAFLAKLSGWGVASRPMKADHAFHSPMMLPAREPFARAAHGLAIRPAGIAMVSGLDGRLFADGYQPGADYWVRQLTERVQFAEGIRVLAQEGCSQFLEVGPSRALVAAGQRILPDKSWISSLRPGACDWAELTDAAARLYTAGRDIDWTGFHHGSGRDRLSLPGYPFERRRHWLPGEPIQKGAEPRMESHPAEPVLEVLTRVLGTLLGPQSSADPDTPFLELGADSLTLFHMLQTVQKTFGVSIPISSLFEELNTLNRLAQHVGQTVPPERAAAPGEQDGVPDGPAVSDTAGPASGLPFPVSPSAGVLSAGVPGAAEFLRVHAQVMGQAYELMRAGRAAWPQPATPEALPSAPPPAATGDSRHGTIALAAKETFVAFRSDGPTQTEGMAGTQGEFARALVGRFAARTRQSRDLAAAERERHSDVRHAPQAFPDLRQIRYPMVVDRSAGSAVWDVDGNQYIDLTMGFGVNLFGHQQPFIISAITEQLAQGMQLGPHSPLAGEVARRICDMTGQQRALFCNTGSEAVMVAVRLARAVTGRRRIALFAGAYHGSADPILARQDIAGGSGESVPMAPGITEDISRNALVLPYGAEDSLDVLRAYQDELAAVLVEPVQSRQPDLQPIEFLRQLRELTRAADVPLIFDEIVTGFRVHPGGVRALFGLSADITTYGKVLGGGLPIGVVAGDARYLNAIDGGAWGFDDTRQPQSVRTFFTGTFAKHPLALAAARAVLDELERRGPSLQEELSARTLSLARRLSAALDSAGIPARVGQFGSLFRFSFPHEPPWSRAVELFYTALLEKGLYIWEGRNCFLSTAHTDADLDAIVTAVARTAAEMVAAGFSFGADRAAPDRAAPDRAVTTTAAGEYPLSRVQHEMWLQDQLGRGRSRAYSEAVLLDLRGELDLDVLRRVMAEILARHDSLHAVIAADGSQQRVVPPQADLPLVDMTGAADGMRQRTAWLEARARDVLDLTARPPVRAAVLRLAADHHELYLGVHHAMIDGWSFDVLLSEISELYSGRMAGRDAALPEPVQYREHVAWERQREESPAWDADVRYWHEQFSDGVPELVLPSDRPRSTAACPLGTFEREIGMDFPGGLPGASSPLGVTPFTVLLAAYTYLLHQVSGQDDLIVGVPFARRGYPGGERMVGNCSTTLPVRSRLPGRTQVSKYIRSIHATLVDAHQHPDFSVSALRERTRVGDGIGGHIFAVTFNMDRATALPRMQGLTVGVAAAPKRFASGDLSFDVLVVDGSFRLTVKYDADLFDRATADRYADLFDQVLRQFVADPDVPLDQVGLASAPMLAPQARMAQDDIEAALRVLPV